MSLLRRRQQHTRRRAAVTTAIGLVASALLLCSAAIGIPASATEGSQTWGVVPSSPDGPNGRASFDLVVAPGAVVTDFVRILNYSKTPQRFDVYAADAFTPVGGGFDLLPANEASEDAGTWIEMGKETVTIPGRSSLDMPFRIRVPETASPGDHAGGIVASRQSDQKTKAGRLALDQRVGARVYLRVEGTVRPILSLNVAATSFTPDNILSIKGRTIVDLQIRNEGNVRLTGSTQVSVSGPFGLFTRTLDELSIPEVLPGQLVTTRVEVADTPAIGRMTASVSLTPVASGDQALSQGPGDTIEVDFWAVSWPLIALVALAIGVLTLFRARRSAKALNPAKPTPSL